LVANRLICLQAVAEQPNRGEDQGFLDRTSDRRVASQRGYKKSSVNDGRDTIGIRRCAQNQNNHQ
jgi:hypothetical protein